MQPYRAEQPNARMLLPNTERVAKRVIVLPTGQQTTPEEVAKICKVTGRALASASPEHRHDKA
jgi:dTDP-4-amino-4,6-dideoxygalactose transaminase